MACGKRCGCAGTCNCVVFGDGHAVEPNCCLDVQGNGTPEFPYVIRNLCPGKWITSVEEEPPLFPTAPGPATLAGDGCGVTAVINGDGTCDNPYNLLISLDINDDPDNQLECTPTGLYVPPPEAGTTPDDIFTRAYRIARKATDGAANCGGTHDIQNLPATKSLSQKDAVDAAGQAGPNGTADGVESGFFVMDEDVNVLTIVNPSDDYPMSVVINTLGRARIDTRARDDWPPASPAWSFGCQIRLGVTISGSVAQDRDYVTQRAQFNVNTLNTGGTSGCTDQSRESQAWTDWDTIPTLRIPAGGSVQISRWCDMQITDEASTTGSALNGIGAVVAREVRWNLPGITVLGVAATHV